MKNIKAFTTRIIFGIVLLIVSITGARAQTTAFTFQGKLTDNSLAATGPYDVVIRLFDSPSGGLQIGTDQVFDDVAVQGGLFTLSLDFGQAAFTSGDSRYIEVSVRPGASSGAFTELTPRQQITSSPYALKSAEADYSETANIAIVAENAAQLGGVPSSQYVLTTDPRMSDARPPAPGSTNYIQNQNTSAQPTSNFNISGTGRADMFTAATQYNIGGNRVLATTAGDNTFLGSNTGSLNTGIANSFFGRFAGEINGAGTENSFFGHSAGRTNTVGISNSFFGVSAGAFNETGSSNAFFGRSAGVSNTTGSSNAFFGNSSGQSNTTGRLNTFVGVSSGLLNTEGTLNTIIGSSATVAFGNLDNATAIGARAVVGQSNSLVLGSINGVNGATADTNVGIGTTAPTSRLHVNGAILVTGPRTSTPSGNAMTISSDAAADTIQSFGNRPLSFNPAGNNVGIFTNEPTSRLDVNGTLRVRTLGTAGSTSLCRNASEQISTCSSSLRYKTNIDRFGFGVDLIRQLRPITFDWINGGMKDLGLGAEDVAAIEPLLVNYNEKGEVEGVKYDRIGVVLINAVKEQQEQIGAQASEITELKQSLESQRKEIAELRAIICAISPNAGICSIPKQ